MTVVADVVENNDYCDIIGSDEFRRNSHVTCRHRGGEWWERGCGRESNAKLLEGS